MSRNFVHLHLHTDHSYLDSVLRISDLVKKAKESGMNACAITDHGTLTGAVRFYKAMKKAGLKPILGCEAYFIDNPAERDKNRKYYHLTLLAKNNEGYNNLCRMISAAYEPIDGVDRFWYSPRVTPDLLEKYSKGIIGMSACIGGELPQMIIRNETEEGSEGYAKLVARAKELRGIFDGDFYLEVMRNGYPLLQVINPVLERLSKDANLKMVATNDVHYLNEQDRELHALVSKNAGSGKKDSIDLSEMVNSGEEKGELWMRTPDEMDALFADKPELLDMSVEIAEKCEVEFSLGHNIYPVYMGGKVDPDSEITKLAKKGLLARGLADNKVYTDRLEYELGEIIRNGYSSYILIVADIVGAARRLGVPVGPGRGSAAGSLVCYALEITDLDPIPYNLLFERFINPERVSPPDIDMDFCTFKRQDVVQYVIDTYGLDHVAQITNYSTNRALGAIDDMARAMRQTGKDVPMPNVERIKEIVRLGTDSPMEHGILKKLLARNAFDKEIDLSAYAGDLLRWASEAEGLIRQLGIHAAGIIISNKPVLDYIPTRDPRSSKPMVFRDGAVLPAAQYDKVDVEDIGLLKMDFLGLDNVSIIQKTLDNIAATGREAPDIRKIPLDDPNVFRLYQSGEVDKVFQMSSTGMRQYLVAMKPDRFEDIIATIALYRPGPLNSGMIDTYINRKNGREEVDYFGLDKYLEKILEPTYGVIVYQEQVMQVAQAVAGFSLGGADILRRAMGKKKPEEMAAQRGAFVEGCAKNGISGEKANELFSIIEKFAEYGFNKSHSAAYALLSYQTAWLKCYYYSAFMAATIEIEKTKKDKTGATLQLARENGLEIVPPDIKISPIQFTAGKNGEIMVGLSGLKNVTENTFVSLDALREKWNKYGWPSNLVDICASSPDFNKKFIESMNSAGAFDSIIGGSSMRSTVHDNMDLIVKLAKKIREREAKPPKKPAPLKDYDPGPGIGISVEASAPWSPLETVSHEYEVLNFNISGKHPVTMCDVKPERTMLGGAKENWKAKVAFWVDSLEVKKTKNGSKPFATGQISDETGSIGFRCWSNQWAKLSGMIEKGRCYMGEGKLERDSRDLDEESQPKLVFTLYDAIPLKEREMRDKDIVIKYPKDMSDNAYHELSRLIRPKLLDNKKASQIPHVELLFMVPGGKIGNLSGKIESDSALIAEIKKKVETLSSGEPEERRPTVQPVRQGQLF